MNNAYNVNATYGDRLPIRPPQPEHVNRVRETIIGLVRPRAAIYMSMDGTYSMSWGIAQISGAIACVMCDLHFICVVSVVSDLCVLSCLGSHIINVFFMVFLNGFISDIQCIETVL